MWMCFHLYADILRGSALLSRILGVVAHLPREGRHEDPVDATTWGYRAFSLEHTTRRNGVDIDPTNAIWLIVYFTLARGLAVELCAYDDVEHGTSTLLCNSLWLCEDCTYWLQSLSRTHDGALPIEIWLAYMQASCKQLRFGTPMHVHKERCGDHFATTWRTPLATTLRPPGDPPGDHFCSICTTSVPLCPRLAPHLGHFCSLRITFGATSPQSGTPAGATFAPFAHFRCHFAPGWHPRWATFAPFCATFWQSARCGGPGRVRQA